MAILRGRFHPVLALSIGVGALALGVGSASVAYSAAHRAAPPAAVIATFDLERVFGALEERTSKLGELDAMKKQLQGELDALANQIKDEKSKADNLAEGPGKTAAAAKVFEMQLNAEAKKKVSENLLELRGTQLLVELYRKIDAAASTLAKQNNYTMVISTDEKLTVPPNAPAQDVQRIMSLRRLYYVAPGHDITEDLVTLLNNEFKAGATTKPR